jgi:tRNA threonylcarbamoyladenosine biosynthesis protein TsaE
VETVESTSPEDTERVAAELSAELDPGDVVTVAGELGAGKTTFVRGAARALGVSEPVTSPTYALGNLYAGRVPVAHLDLYRVESLGEADWADLEPYFEDAVAFVEWPERGEAFLPEPAVRVRLRHMGDFHRLIEVERTVKSLQKAHSSPC